MNFSKYLVFTFYFLCSLGALVILVLSIGWYLPIFSIVLLPALIMHVLAGIRAFKLYPLFNFWLILSGIALLMFTLFREDTDAHGGFTGWSVMKYHLGISNSMHAPPGTYGLEITLLILTAMIFLNTVILRRKIKQ